MTQPQPYQLSPLNDRQQEVFNLIQKAEVGSTSVIGFGGAVGGGKLLALNTLVQTRWEWKTIGDLAVGDVLFDDLGKQTKVLAVHPIALLPESYRLRFDDGTEIEACADHLWKTFTHAEMCALTSRTPEWRARRRAARPSRGKSTTSIARLTALATHNQTIAQAAIQPPPQGNIRTTGEIAATLWARGNRQANHAIPVAAPLDFPHADLLLDPYLFGLWLGDGSKGGGTFSTQDETHMLGAFENAGFRWRKIPNESCDYYIYKLAVILRKIGVLGNKHIPYEYLRSHRDQRLALLQGLLDTDGTVARNSGAAEFCNTNKQIVDGVQELIVSLGWKCNVREGRAKLYGKDCGPKWTIKWAASEYVFRLPRKRDLQRLATRRTTRFRYVVACNKIPPVPMRCITVDSPSGLFLVSKNMVPTHNTFLDARLALMLSVVYPGNRGVIGRLEMNKLVTTTLEQFDTLTREIPGLIVKSNDQSPVYRDIRLASWPKDIKSRVYFRGVADWTSFGSEQYGFAIIDETNEINVMAPAMLITRLRHRLPKIVEEKLEAAGVGMKYVFLASSNPYPGWFEKWFHDKDLTELLDAVPGLKISVHFVASKIADNPYLPEGYAEQQLAFLRGAGLGQFAERMIEGRWDVYEGKIYEGFNPSIHRWLKPIPGPLEYDRVVGGLDFGQESATAHFTAGIVSLVLKDGRLLRVAEFRDRGPNIYERQLGWMVQQQMRWADPIKERIQWCADRSQSVGIKQWQGNFRVKMSKGGPDSVDEGIKVVAARLERDGAGIPGSFYLPELTMWEEEMRTYRRDPETMKVIKKDDDLVACDRYSHELLEKWRVDPQRLFGGALPRVAQ